MTRAEFNRLPLLVRAQEARSALGCDRRVLAIMRRNYPALAIQIKGMTEFRYRKEIIAKIAKLDYE